MDEYVQMRNSGTEDHPYSLGWPRYVNIQISNPLDLLICIEEGRFSHEPHSHSISARNRVSRHLSSSNSLPPHYPTGKRQKDSTSNSVRLREGLNVCMLHQTLRGRVQNIPPFHPSHHPHTADASLPDQSKYFGTSG